jgi:hypothetical protein
MRCHGDPEGQDGYGRTDVVFLDAFRSGFTPNPGFATLGDPVWEIPVWEIPVWEDQGRAAPRKTQGNWTPVHAVAT